MNNLLLLLYSNTFLYNKNFASTCFSLVLFPLINFESKETLENNARFFLFIQLILFVHLFLIH